MTQLPDDCLTEILQFIPIKFLLLNCCVVSRQWKSCTLKTKLSIQLRSVKLNQLTNSTESLIVIDTLHLPFTASPSEVETIINLSNLSNLKCLNISHIRMNISQLCNSQSIQQLTRLVLRSCSLDNDSLAIIGSSAKSLTSLNITRNNITKEGIDQLEPLKYLSSLFMSGNPLMSSGGVLSLQNISSNLTELDMSDCQLFFEDVKAISSNENSFILKYLDLSNNNLTIDAINQLCKSKCLDLTHLYIEQTGLTLDGVKMIASSMSKLTNLGLSSNIIKDEGLVVLCQSSNMANIKLLLLSQCMIGNEGIIALSKSQFITKLTNLNLCFNDFDSEGIKIFSQSSNISKIRNLNLSSCFFNDESAKHLASCSFNNIELLNLADNQIGDEGMKHLSSNPSFSNLKNLHLFANAISNEGAKHLASGTFRKLRILDVSVNNIGDEGIQAIGSSDVLTNLSMLTVVDNKFTGGSCLVGNGLNNLQTLVIGQNSLDEKDFEKLKKENFKKESSSIDMDLYQGVFVTFQKITQ